MKRKKPQENKFDENETTKSSLKCDVEIFIIVDMLRPIHQIRTFLITNTDFLMPFFFQKSLISFEIFKKMFSAKSISLYC